MKNEVDWASIRVGDLDVTTLDGPDDELGCSAIDPEDTFFCTRTIGHRVGPHVAGNGSEVLAVWPAAIGPHVARPGPLHYDWRCLDCGDTCASHPSRLSLWLRRLGRRS